MKYLYLLVPLSLLLITSYSVARKEGFEQGYDVFTGISSIYISISTVGLFLDYLVAFDWYKNLFWLFQGIILFSSAIFYLILSIFVLVIILVFTPKALFKRVKNKRKFLKFLSTTFAVIIGFLAIWWFFPDESSICHRYLDGRYSYKTAEKKWIGGGRRYGSERGLIDNCNDYIPYVDPDKLITNKEGFWDTFYNKHIQGLD